MSSSSEKKSMNCFVCTERFNSGTHTAIKCPNEGCGYVACETCVCEYLLGQASNNPKCMSCRKDWSFEFLSEVTPESFHNKDYRIHRTKITREREESLMPTTQALVQTEKIRKDKEKKIKKIQNENALFMNIVRENNKKITDLRYERHHSQVLVDKKKEKFVRRCPVEECKGFLKASLKCGLCDGWACKDCHCAKTSRNDNDHKCNPETVATIKLLASDTKNCPSCAVPISKIEGCDQMFCVECHTAFSWKTGEIEKGVIHNPHFYQWQRQQNGGVAPRVRGDVRCGGIPQIWEIESALRRAGIDFPEVYECHRLIGHINNVVLYQYPNQPVGEDNTDLRIKYLMNELTNNAFISQLKKREKKREKDLAINMILTMFTGTLGDLFGNMLVIKPEEINNLIIQMIELRKYVNENLEKVRRRFNNKVPFINKQWQNLNKL